MVYWETAHTVPNLPQFLRDWTRGWTLSATMADCKLTTFQVNACRYPSLTPFDVNTSAKHEGGIPHPPEISRTYMARVAEVK